MVSLGLGGSGESPSASVSSPAAAAAAAASASASATASLSLTVTAEWLPRVRAGHVHAHLCRRRRGSARLPVCPGEEDVLADDCSSGDSSATVSALLPVLQLALDPQRQQIRVFLSPSVVAAPAEGGTAQGIDDGPLPRFATNEISLDLRGSGLDASRFRALRSLAEENNLDAHRAASLRLTPAGSLTELPGRVKYDSFLFDRTQAVRARGAAGAPRSEAREGAEFWCARPLRCRRCVTDSASRAAPVVDFVSSGNAGSDWCVRTLPSEHWLEIADSWLCGCACSDGVTEFAGLPLGEIVPKERELLVGDSHILVHRNAVSAVAMEARFDQVFRPADGSTSAGPRRLRAAAAVEDGPHDHRHPGDQQGHHHHRHEKSSCTNGGDARNDHDLDEEYDGASAAAQASELRKRQWLVPLRCRTCGSVLGTLPLGTGGAGKCAIAETDVPSHALPLAEVGEEFTHSGVRLYYYALDLSEAEADASVRVHDNPSLSCNIEPAAERHSWFRSMFTLEKAVSGMLVACLQIQQAPLVTLLGFGATPAHAASATDPKDTLVGLKIRLLSKDIFAFQETVHSTSEQDSAIRDRVIQGVAPKPVVKVAFSDMEIRPDSAVPEDGSEVLWIPHDALLALRRRLHKSNEGLPPRLAKIPVAGLGRAPIAYLETFQSWVG